VSLRAIFSRRSDAAPALNRSRCSLLTIGKPIRCHRVGAKKGLPITDQWSKKLRCPLCRNTGTARLSQFNGAQKPTVDGVPDGFRVIQTEYGSDFRCADCNVPAAP
jgi:hypothetical protein